MRKSQSAMEYLMTYGWAILIIAIVVAVLFSLGLFGNAGSSGTGACISIPGYQCTTPVLASNGMLSATIGQVGQTITVNAVACTGSSSPPSSFTPLGANVVLASDQVAAFQFACPEASGQIGKAFTGSLWIEYTNQNGQSAKVRAATVKVAVTSIGGPASPITYSYNGMTIYAQYATIGLPEADSYDFCAAIGYIGDFGTSWVSETYPDPWSSIGHQAGSTTCESGDGWSTSSYAIAGVAVGNVPSYTIQASGASSSAPYTFTYATGDTGQYTFILLSGVSYSMSSVSVSPASGSCSTLEDQEYSGYAYVYECSGQSANTYTVTVTPSGADGSYLAAYAAYSVG